MLAGELLEERAGGAPAARARDHQRRERAQPHRLQDLLRHDDFARAVAAGLGRERDADRVADAFLQQHRHRGGRGDDALGAHAGLGEPQVQRVVAARGELAVDAIRSCTAAHLAREHDAVAGQAELLGACARSRAPRRSAPRASRRRRRAGSRACAFSSIMRASSSWSRLPQLTPMRTGLPCWHAFSIMVANCSSRFAPLADVAGVDAVLVERCARSREPAASSLWPLKWKSPTSGTLHAHGVERGRGSPAPARAASAC